MIIGMTIIEADNLAEFLNREYEELRQKHKRQGRSYSMTQFADHLGIGQPTLFRLMKLGPDKKPVEGIDTPILLALYDAYGSKVMDALRGDALVVTEKREAEKREKGQGDAG